MMTHAGGSVGSVYDSSCNNREAFFAAARNKLMCSDDSEYANSLKGVKNTTDTDSGKFATMILESPDDEKSYLFPVKDLPSTTKKTPITLDTDTGFSRYDSYSTRSTSGTFSGKSGRSDMSAEDYLVRFPTQRLPRKSLPKSSGNCVNGSTAEERSPTSERSPLSADRVRSLACSGIAVEDDDDDDNGFMLERDYGREDGHKSFEDSEDD